MTAGFAEWFPETELVHIVDDSLLPEVRSHGVTPAVRKRLTLYALAAEATGAEAAVIRVTGENGMLDARSVVSLSEVLAAELAGSSFPVVELKGDESRGDQLPEAVRRARPQLAVS